MGGVIGIIPLITGIVFGANQQAIDTSNMGGGLAIFVLISFLISGWSLLPFYYVNAGGGYASYYLGCLFALLPIIITGVMYIVGAYGRRNKT